MVFQSRSSATMGDILPEQFNLQELLPSQWRELLTVQDSTWRRLQDEVDAAEDQLSPARELIFAALRIPPTAISCVILGQDPYPKREDACGIAFSVPRSEKLPPTLKNIFREYQSDTGYPVPFSGDLSSWVDQGVLLLNTSLTCVAGQSLSHSDIGWSEVTSEILRVTSATQPVAILWGSHAQKYRPYFEEEFTLSSPHPSPLSAYRGFFGSKPFTRANEILTSRGVTPISWRLPSA